MVGTHDESSFVLVIAMADSRPDERFDKRLLTEKFNGQRGVVFDGWASKSPSTWTKQLVKETLMPAGKRLSLGCCQVFGSQDGIEDDVAILGLGNAVLGCPGQGASRWVVDPGHLAGEGREKKLLPSVGRRAPRRTTGGQNRTSKPSRVFRGSDLLLLY